MLYTQWLLAPSSLLPVSIILCNNVIQAFPNFRSAIPNGNRVPNPCNRQHTWPGVGHEQPEGNGPRLQFGRDFHKANNTWTIELCRKDSDGDGKTNGEELGDPDCVWQVGTVPTVTDRERISHPGICEPIESARCAGQIKALAAVEACKSVPSVMWCPAISAPFVQSLAMRLTFTNVPASDNSYLCRQFFIPDDIPYHIIAWEPVVASQSPESIHHITLFACEDTNEEARLRMLNDYDNASECSIKPPCSSMIAIWSSGSPKRCYGNEVGIPMGKGYYKTMIVQVHYNNADKRFDLFDSSGIFIYFTPVLRPNDKGMLAIGQTDIAIPPHEKTASVVGRGFNGECSRKQLAPYNSYRIVSLMFHMHEAGVYGRLSLSKNSTGERITILQGAMSYKKPTFVSWSGSDQLELQPGDAIEIECRYDTSQRSKWTFWGGSSSTEETCSAFIDIYPRPLNKGDLDYCTTRGAVIGNCSKNSIAGILQNTESSKSGGMLASCSCPGIYPSSACSSSCYLFLSRAGLLTHPCMLGMAFHSITRDWISPVPSDIYNIQSQTDICLLQHQQKGSAPTNGTKCGTPGGSNEATAAYKTTANFIGATLLLTLLSSIS